LRWRGRQLDPVLGLALEHGLLNLIGETVKVDGQPIKHFPFRVVGRKIADQGAFGCVRPELFQMGLVVLHRRYPLFCFSEFRSGNIRKSN